MWGNEQISGRAGGLAPKVDFPLQTSGAGPGRPMSPAFPGPFPFLTPATGDGPGTCHTGSMPGHRRVVTVALIGGLLLGACDSGSGSKATSGGATETTATSSPRVTAPSALDGPPCTVATAALVSEKLGFTLSGPNVDRGPAATVCTYDNPTVRSQSATVQLQDQATPASFAKGRDGFSSHGERVAAVGGLGDEAYSASLSVANITNTTLVARKGSTEVLITTTAPADRLPALMTAILALV